MHFYTIVVHPPTNYAIMAPLTGLRPAASAAVNYWDGCFIALSLSRGIVQQPPLFHCLHPM